MNDFHEYLKENTNGLSANTTKTYAYNLQWLRKRIDGFNGIKPPKPEDILEYMETSNVGPLRRQSSYVALKVLHNCCNEHDCSKCYGLPLVECHQKLSSERHKQQRSQKQKKNWVDFGQLKKFAACLRTTVYKVDKDKLWNKNEYAMLQLAFILTYHLKYPVRRDLASVVYDEGPNRLHMKTRTITYTQHKNSRWRKNPYVHKLTRETWRLVSLIRKQQKMRKLESTHLLLNRYWNKMTPNGYSSWLKREMKTMPECGDKRIGVMAIRHSVISHHRRKEMRLLQKDNFAERCMHGVKTNELYVID